MKNSCNHERMAQLLKDRQDYRRALIQKRNDLDTKLKKLEDEIFQLRRAA